MTEASAADLAVVIVNYETGAWLERCLRSLERAQGDVSVDVIVIDNASRDGSADVSEALGARLIRNDTNRWLSPAWNQGAATTQAPYLLFLNPDTEWSHGTLAGLVAVVGRRDRTRVRVAVHPEQPNHAALRDGRLGSVHRTRARLASRNLARGLARPPHPRRARMADRKVQEVNAVVLVGGFRRVESQPHRHPRRSIGYSTKG